MTYNSGQELNNNELRNENGGKEAGEKGLICRDERQEKAKEDFKKVIQDIENNMGEVIMKARINGNGQLVDKWLNPSVKLRGGEIVFISDAD